MKTIKQNLAFTICFVLTLFMISCSKSDETKPIVYPEENFLNSYLTQSNVALTDSDILPGQESECGILFTALVTGNINSVDVKIPTSNANLRLTIWDAVTLTPIKTEFLNVTGAGVLTTKSISGVKLIKGQKYAISINSNAFYGYNRGNLNYPITAGNIRVDGYGYHTGSTQTFCSNMLDYRYRGLVGFAFQQTE